ncbi:hypothetical protein WOLCODRAFT_133039 [Wolfiporia cocos MD-104 SS10]|uniref:F-box domain-containing protein n=1 Tax=Wolfiporia cocos (strain MD-104) TaxID=742152 RepID=A0A2H3K1F1_WOLCO|nr:hypothetical protein WOLCODRAFT_133039 [Wolfiporia cocos MD-104 SS10]
MSFRSLSPGHLPPPKRLHVAQPSGTSSVSRVENPGSFFDTILYDEIILSIFFYLSWIDLCVVQRTNRNWSRLSLDNQLWKSLYLLEYGRPRLRGVRGFFGRTDGREVRPLPGHAKSEDIKDWKWMFRISSNWRTGRSSVETLDAQDHLMPSTTIQEAGRVSEETDEKTHLLLSGNMTIAATSRRSRSPRIMLMTPVQTIHVLSCHSTRPAPAVCITALALDQSPPSPAHRLRLVSLLSTGEFVLFSIDHHTPANSSRVLTYAPTTRSARTSPINQAVYHHPLLATLSESFHLSLYDLSDNTIRHTQTLTSFTSHPPSSLVLSTISPSTYKLVLAYAIPVYPSHWSVGATELIIRGDPDARMTVTATRTTRAIDVPQGWIDENKLRLIREQWARKVARVADTQTDGKWVVLAPADPLAPSALDSHAAPTSASHSSSSASSSRMTTYTSSSMHTASALQLYRLHLPASGSASAPKLTFVRSLHGQIGPVSSLSLADGRCVSLGVNGSIWVWDLEGGTGAEVSGAVDALGESRGRKGEEKEEPEREVMSTKGSVVFDERKIVSASGGEVKVWRFDV